MRRIGKRHYFIAAAFLLALLVLENAQFFGVDKLMGYLTLLSLKTALWVALGVFIAVFPSSMFSGLIRLKSVVINLAFLFSGFYLLCYILIGIFTAFGKSIYSMTPAGIAANLVPMGAALFGGESCRSFLVNSLAKKQHVWVILGVSVLFSLFSLSLNSVSGLGDSIEVLDYLTNTVFPQLTLSVAASCFAYLAGPIPAAVYLGIIRAFGYLSPYLPNPDQIPKLLFNVFMPLVSIYAVMKIYAREALEPERSDRKDGLTAGWIATYALSVAIVWFSVGVFPVYPSVILTGSMEPKIMPGDVVLVRKIGSESVAIGDIIMFQTVDNIYVTHRVIEKTKDEAGGVLFVTKGDNNTNRDTDPVNPSQLKGRVITVLPDIGKLTLYLRGDKET